MSPRPGREHAGELAKASLRGKRAESQLALEGSVGAHQRFMLQRQLREVDFLEAEIKTPVLHMCTFV